MGIETGTLLDETSLMDDSCFSVGDKDFGTTSSTKQVVIVSPCIWVWINNGWFGRNNMNVTVYRADIGTNGTVNSEWTQVTKTSHDDESKEYVANIDATAAGADVDLGIFPFAIVWKFVCNPKSDGFLADSKSKIAFHWGGGGISGTSDYYSNTNDYETVNSYSDLYQGKELLILNKGFRMAHAGGYKTDSPGNYVTFKRDTLIQPGHTVVFKP